MCEATTTDYVFYSGRKQAGENYYYYQVSVSDGFDGFFDGGLKGGGLVGYRLQIQRGMDLRVVNWLKNISLPQVCSALGSCASSRTYAQPNVFRISPWIPPD